MPNPHPNRLATLTSSSHEPAPRNPVHTSLDSGDEIVSPEFDGGFTVNDAYWAWEIAQEQAAERYLESRRAEDAHLDSWDGYGTD